MNLFRLKLIPCSPWRTPWQADTLTGLLCIVCARSHGPDVLREHLLEPMLVGRPPFVLSDACPGNLLPIPLSVRLRQWPAERYKAIKRARWVSPTVFNLLRRTELRGPDQLLSELHPDEDLLLTRTHQHNTLSRLSDTTGEAESGLGLFSRPDIHLRTHSGTDSPNQSLGRADYLSLYFRAATPNACELLLDLLGALSETGFGADVATGRGQFEIAGDPEPMPDLDAAPEGANAAVCLSTFQPGPSDPTKGFWEAFPKFGKLGPDLGLADVRKRTLILFRPGGCFHIAAPRSYLGRTIPMDELLPPESAAKLRGRGINVVHPAFGLTLPAKLSWEALS